MRMRRKCVAMATDGTFNLLCYHVGLTCVKQTLMNKSNFNWLFSNCFVNERFTFLTTYNQHCIDFITFLSDDGFLNPTRSIEVKYYLFYWYSHVCKSPLRSHKAHDHTWRHLPWDINILIQVITNYCYSLLFAFIQQIMRFTSSLLTNTLICHF